MKKLLTLFALLIGTYSYSQYGPNTPVQQVQTIIALKQYNGTSAFVYVTDSLKLYTTCSPCTADEVYVFAGAGGKRWRTAPSQLSGSTIDSGALHQSDTLRFAYRDKNNNFSKDQTINGMLRVSDKSAIGTTTPANTVPSLFIKAPSANVPLILTDFTSAFGLTYMYGGGAFKVYSDYYMSGPEPDLIFGTYSNQGNQLYLKRTGMVGIGTNNPITKLDVQGTAAIRDSLLLSVTRSGSQGDSLLTKNAGIIHAIPQSSLRDTNATNITTGTLADARLSNNVALKNINNQFSANQNINGSVYVRDSLTVGYTRSGLVTDSVLTKLNGVVRAIPQNSIKGDTSSYATFVKYSDTLSGGQIATLTDVASKVDTGTAQNFVKYSDTLPGRQFATLSDFIPYALLNATNNFLAPQKITSTTGPQFGIYYDGTNYFTMTVGTTGQTTFAAFGTSASLQFNNGVVMNGNMFANANNSRTLGIPTVIWSNVYSKNFVAGISGSLLGTVVLNGNTSGAVTIQPAAAAGTYNFTLPNTAGTAGQVLTSAGGGSNAMTWTDRKGITSWTTVTAAQTMVAGAGYLSNGSSQITFTLPTTAAAGDIFSIVGLGAGGWKIAQNASQSIKISGNTTTTGTAGYIQSGTQYDAIEIICVVANTTFVVRSSQGTLTPM